MMSFITQIIFYVAMALILPLGATKAQVGSNGPVFQVAYFEVAAASQDKAAAMLARFGAASQQESGSVHFDALEELGRPNRFAILEGWDTRQALDGHQVGANASDFRSRFQPSLVSPFDPRPHTGLVIGTPTWVRGNAAGVPIYVLCHVDVVPTSKDEGVKYLQALVEASRMSDGALAFFALQQDTRPNHFTLVEVWRDKAALEAHAQAPETLLFRQRLLALSGGLYDERFYRMLSR